MALRAAGNLCLRDTATSVVTQSADILRQCGTSCGLLLMVVQLRALSQNAGSNTGSNTSSAVQQDAAQGPLTSAGTAQAPVVETTLAQPCSSDVNPVLSPTTAVVPVSVDRPTASYLSAEVLTNISSTVNQLTGYESIDRLKASVVAADRHLQHCKQQLQAAKGDYEQQLAKQTQLHREVTALLQRKSSWIPADVSRFTELYAAEHETEQAVAAAKARYAGLGDEAERLQLQLVDLIRERYQQEQLWSDKIRRASTWWTWGLMGLHFASFVLVYSVFEPRKRAALQEAIAGMLEQHTAAVDTRFKTLTATAAAAKGGEADSVEQERFPKQQQQKQRPEASVKQQRQQDEHAGQVSSAAGEQNESFQQQIMQEFRSLRQQLQELQEAAPTAAAAAAAQAAVAGEQPTRLHLPGSRWMAQQWAAATQSVNGLWQISRHKAQQLLARNQQAVGESQQPAQAVNEGQVVADRHLSRQQPSPQQQEENKQQPRLEHTTSHVAQEVQSPATVTGRPQTTPAASSQTSPVGDGPASEIPPSLVKQWASGGRVLKVTRGQLAAITAGASAVGAGLAAVLVVLLRSSGGASSS